MQFYGLRKHCADCGKEINEAKKEIGMMRDRYEIDRPLCIWCMHKQQFKKR